MNDITASERREAAAKLELDEQYLYQLLTRRRPVPLERCPDIERAFDGRVVCEQLRADVRWIRVPDQSWPHKAGRPCADTARAA